MNPLLRILKPTPLAVFLMLVALAVIGIASSSFSTVSFGTEMPEQTEFSIGIGAPVKVISVGASRSTQIHWPILLLQLAAIYLAANRVAIDLVRVTRLRRPATAYGTVMGILLVLSFLGAISISKAYWGYWMSPPKPLRQAGLIATVREAGVFKTERDASGKPVLVPDQACSMADLLDTGMKYGADSFQGRIVVPLKSQKILPDNLSTNMALLPELYRLISSTGVLLKSTPGYDSAAELYGIVVEATAKDDGRCLLVGFSGGQLSNDHYPYYELFFQEDRARQVWELTHDQHYFYDVAGMEGFEWPAIGILLSIVVVPLGLGIFTVGRVVVRKRNLGRE